ncbi:UDP-N-acetylmuramoyl-L-alanine--D-glutamate ligase [Candidatus Uhrbacteria bacterium]|nr:UDP-N-acetylmuramoyl-L-alanine--D-glutamate ligase [Candidatus Uhrbacteria bacterium]
MMHHMRLADWLSDIREKRVLVMGLGLHGGGCAVARWLLRRGASVVVTDLRSRAVLLPSVRLLEATARERGSGSLVLVLGEHRADDFRNTDLVVQNPGVPRDSSYLAIAQRAGIPIANEASLFLARVRAMSVRPGSVQYAHTIVAVTGTRGKSTTAALIAAMSAAAGRTTVLAGNIRIPMFAVLDRTERAMRKGPVTVVLELSSWHCEHLSRATGGPDIAVLTNLYPDHLNRYPSMRSYALAKARLFRFQSPESTAVVNVDQSITRVLAEYAPGRVIPVAMKPPRTRWSGVTITGNQIRTHGTGAAVIAHRSRSPLLGVHNTMNIAIAAATARAMGCSTSAVDRALAQFTGLPGRLERIAVIRGVTYINDTCATSPDGTISALAAVEELRHQTPSGRIILLGGGTNKGLTFDRWAEAAVRHVAMLVLFAGTATDLMQTELARYPEFLRTHRVVVVRTMRAAFAQVRRVVQPGDLVLLSPGAASFGCFLHEFDRGDQFIRAVRAQRSSIPS